MHLVRDADRQIGLFRAVHKLYSCSSRDRYGGFSAPGPSQVKCLQQNARLTTSGIDCMQLSCSVLGKSCGMACFNLLINNRFFWQLIKLGKSLSGAVKSRCINQKAEFN